MCTCTIDLPYFGLLVEVSHFVIASLRAAIPKQSAAIRKYRVSYVASSETGRGALPDAPWIVLMPYAYDIHEGNALKRRHNVLCLQSTGNSNLGTTTIRTFIRKEEFNSLGNFRWVASSPKWNEPFHHLHDFG